MDKPRVVLKSDGIYLEEPVCGSVVRRTPIMTKEEMYNEAFKKWILLAEREEQEHDNYKRD